MGVSVKEIHFRAGPFGIKIEVVDISSVDFSGKDIGGIIFQYPDTEGSIHDFTDIISAAKYENHDWNKIDLKLILYVPFLDPFLAVSYYL